MQLNKAPENVQMCKRKHNELLLAARQSDKVTNTPLSFSMRNCSITKHERVVHQVYPRATISKWSYYNGQYCRGLRRLHGKLHPYFQVLMKNV